jgi:hypothetical protein
VLRLLFRLAPKLKLAYALLGGGDRMGWFILAQVFSILITIVRIGRLPEQEKELEILILRQQPE